MKLEKTRPPFKNHGWLIKVTIGRRENISFWQSPPSSVDHVHLGYLTGRYPIVNTERRCEKFKLLYKKLLEVKI